MLNRYLFVTDKSSIWRISLNGLKAKQFELPSVATSLSLDYDNNYLHYLSTHDFSIYRIDYKTFDKPVSPPQKLFWLQRAQVLPLFSLFTVFVSELWLFIDICFSTNVRCLDLFCLKWKSRKMYSFLKLIVSHKCHWYRSVTCQRCHWRKGVTVTQKCQWHLCVTDTEVSLTQRVSLTQNVTDANVPLTQWFVYTYPYSNEEKQPSGYLK